MRNKEKDAVQMAIKRRDFLAKAYELFAKKNIESVTMAEITRECGYGTMTIYRYFKTKPQLVVAVGAWIWEQAIRENWEYRPDRDFEGMTGAEIFEYYLESFIGLYRNHRDLLRFNQFFNIYIQSERIDPKVLKPYREAEKELSYGIRKGGAGSHDPHGRVGGGDVLYHASSDVGGGDEIRGRACVYPGERA